MMDGNKQRYDDGSKHAAAGIKLLFVKQDNKTLSPWPSFKRRPSFRRRRMAAASPNSLMVWIIIAAHIISLVPLVHCGYITIHVTTELFKLNERSHAEMFGIIYGIAVDVMPRLEVQGRRFLGPKDIQPPSLGGDGSGPGRWIEVPFQGDNEDDQATIALADSTLYLLAFKNNIGTWHCFKGYEHMFPNCVVLNPELDERGNPVWDESYPRLIEKGADRLHTVPLGKNSDKEATRILAHYRHGVSSLPELKEALVRKMIMYAEALRIREVLETFSGEFWETETYLSSSKELVKRIVNWGKMSFLVWQADSDGGELLRNHEQRKVGKYTGISNLQDAVNVYILFRRPDVLRINVPQNE